MSNIHKIVKKIDKDTWKDVYSGEEVDVPKWVVFPWEEK